MAAGTQRATLGHLGVVACSGQPRHDPPGMAAKLGRAALKSSTRRFAPPFLGPRIGCGSGLRRKLKHCCFLTFKHISQQHPLPVWKFERIMMCMRVVLRGREEVRARGQTKVYKTRKPD